MRQRVTAARVARLVTVDAAGQPHAVPVCFVLQGETIFSAIDHKPKRGGQLRRVRNLTQTGRACVLVDEYAEDWSSLWWVRLDGAGRLVTWPNEADGAVAALVAKYPQYREHRPAGPVLAVDIVRWRGWSAS